MSALTLRAIACACMLLDHIGAAFDLVLLRYIGRLAFPIYMYLIYNGYKHTSSKGKYALRLAAFAVISQVPFSLFSKGIWWTWNLNVFVSLLLGLLCIWAADSLRRYPVGKWLTLVPSLVLFALYALGFIRSDHGSKVAVMAMTFLLFDGKEPWKRILTVLGCAFAVFYPYTLVPAVKWALGMKVTLTSLDNLMLQSFYLLALPLIFRYNGQKGRSTKALQYGFYAFYPVHLLILWLI